MLSASADLPTRPNEDRISLVDTSVAIPLVVADHEAHELVVGELQSMRLGLSGHAWFETYSVLTRLPPGARRSPADVRAILAHDFPESSFLEASELPRLQDEMARLGIAGGAVYDALVGASARAAGRTLLSRDRRAAGTYAALGVDVRFMG